MKHLSKQQGFALILLIAIITGATASFAVKIINGNNRIARDRITQTALAQAKDALIGYAITYADTHTDSVQVQGYLPCPDVDGRDIGNNPAEGIAELGCGNRDVSAIGRLPWRTLDLDPLHDGNGECLWYAVSGSYKNNPKTGLMNWDTNGQFQVYASDGTTLLTPADNQAVAVIFSPGSATTGQNRAGQAAPVCGGNYTAGNYLDASGAFNNAAPSATAGAPSQFRFGDPDLPSGDRMVFITRSDIWNALQRRSDFMNKLDALTQKSAECIAGFGARNRIDGTMSTANKSLPWPARTSLVDYSQNTGYNDHDNLFAGRVPYLVNTSRGQSGNAIPSPYYLLQADGANCPAGWAALYPWWDNWKDHLFYAIGQKFRPDNNATGACDNSHCLHANGSGNYAAIVIFANKGLSNQTRAGSVTDLQRGIAANYLEGNNALNVANQNASGREDYQVTAGANFNDIVYCITESLAVVKGNPAAASPCP